MPQGEIAVVQLSRLGKGTLLVMKWRGGLLALCHSLVVCKGMQCVFGVDVAILPGRLVQW